MFPAVVEFIKSLNLSEKLSPRKNVEIIWFYIFLPCLIAYFVLLTGFINSKPAIGSIETLHPSFNSLIYANKKMEIIASDLTFTEGPLWVEDEASSSNFLMFSDIRLNRIYKWEDGKGLFTVGKTIYVEKSGCKSNETYCDQLVQGGSNGLLRRSKTSLDLILCQHGERAVSLIAENGVRHPIATHYKGLRLNSPNDLIYSPEGHIYFTDPKFGLFDKNGKVVGKELQHSGVYMVRNEHLLLSLAAQMATPMVKLLDASLSWPNGLAFSPDYSKLYVSNADKKNAYWKVFDVADDGTLNNGKVFFNATDLYQEECSFQMTATNQTTCDMRNIGAPDGLKVDIYGNVFATGPGGILVINPAGQLIGRFRLDRPVSNLVFGTDGRLYITAKDIVARVWIKTKPTRIVSV